MTFYSFLLGEAEQMEYWKNQFHAAGYGIQRSPSETYGPHGGVIWFTRKDVE